MLNSWPEENIKVCGMSSVDWEITGSLVQKRYLVELLGIIYRTGCLKGQANNAFLPKTIFRLNLFPVKLGLQRLYHVGIQSRTTFSEVAGSWSMKKNVHVNKFAQNRGPSEKVRYVY